MFRMLNAQNFQAPNSPFLPGPAPFLEWIAIDKLVVDPSYQRDIGKRGTLNIRQIAEHFDWSKFAPVIVAPVEGGCFAIVDGQHRTTAALLRGLEKVPCQVVQADRAKQAEAFAAVNGNVTKTTPQQLFHAKVAASDPEALELRDVCAAAMVEIVRNSKVQAALKPGQTQAVGAISRCLKLFGKDTLITALQCITQTGDGNPGMVRATIIEALCEVLHTQGRWRESGERLLRVMDKFSFVDAWEKAIEGRSTVLSPAVKSQLADLIREHLSKTKAKAA